MSVDEIMELIKSATDALPEASKAMYLSNVAMRTNEALYPLLADAWKKSIDTAL